MSVQAIDRVLAILDAVTRQAGGATASEVAARTDLSLSTATRLLHQLAERQVVARADGDRRYILGPRLFGLARRGSAQVDLTALARPVLQRVNEATGETASLHVRRGDARVCVAMVASPHAVARHVPVGTALPLHRNATGEVLLAGAPHQDRARYVGELRLPPRDEEELAARLERIAADGWALVVDDWVPGVTGLSAAVRDGAATVAALSVSGPAERFDPDAAMGHLPMLLAAARELSERSAGTTR
jgi:IclR family acetate operon transcriptional repressor